MNLIDWVSAPWEWLRAQTLQDQISMVGLFVGALGMLGIFEQLRQQGTQNRTEFEEMFDERYRSIMSTVPTKALLGETLSDEEYGAAFDELYRYIDLCNEQAYLHLRGKVREKTWLYWLDGIRANLKRPAFGRAWEEVSRRAPNDFRELRKELARAERAETGVWRQLRRSGGPGPARA